MENITYANNTSNIKSFNVLKVINDTAIIHVIYKSVYTIQYLLIIQLIGFVNNDNVVSNLKRLFTIKNKNEYLHYNAAMILE